MCSGQTQDFRRVACGLRLFLFGGVERDLFFKPVRLEGEQTLIDSDTHAVAGQIVRIGATFGKEGHGQAAQFRIEGVQEADALEPAGATRLAVSVTVSQHGRQKLSGGGAGQRQVLRPQGLGDSFLLVGHQEEQPEQLALAW